MNKNLEVLGKSVGLVLKNNEEYICLTDIAKHKNEDDPRFVIQNWMKTNFTVEFLGLWEVIHNLKFNRVEFDTFRNNSASNAFVLTPTKWISKTNVSYGGKN